MCETALAWVLHSLCWSAYSPHFEHLCYKWYLFDKNNRMCYSLSENHFSGVSQTTISPVIKQELLISLIFCMNSKYWFKLFMYNQHRCFFIPLVFKMLTSDLWPCSNGSGTSEDLFWKLDALQTFIKDLHWPEEEFGKHLETRLKLMSSDMIESCVKR